jgi:[acyl-carrier-protein] S-malonyltransferase
MVLWIAEGVNLPAPAGPYAILMAGQLSEREGMAAGLSGHPIFERLGTSFDALTEGRFRTWVTTSPQEEISEKFTAPEVMVLYDILCGHVALERFGKPAAVAGYSLGFYAAAVLARSTTAPTVLTWLDRVNARNRDTFAPGQFKLLAVTGLGLEELRRRLTEWSLDEVEVANINNARQLVLAGSAGAIDRLTERLQGLVLDQKPLPLDIPLHTPFLEPARQAVADWWASVPAGAPVMPLLSPVNGKPIVSGASFKRHMLESLIAPTDWQAVVAEVRSMGILTVLDTSPGGELGRMARWVARDLKVLPVSSLWEGEA